MICWKCWFLSGGKTEEDARTVFDGEAMCLEHAFMKGMTLTEREAGGEEYEVFGEREDRVEAS